MFDSYFSNGRQWFKCTTHGQSGLTTAPTKAHSQTSESQTSLEKKCTVYDDEGAVSPRCPDGSTSTIVHSSDPCDHDTESSAESVEASTGESNTQPESNAANDPMFSADEEVISLEGWIH